MNRIAYTYSGEGINNDKIEGKGVIIGSYGIEHKSNNKVLDGTLPHSYFIILTDEGSFITLPIECCKSIKSDIITD